MSDLLLKFQGGYADDHIVPAIGASQALEGISRSLNLVSHYLVTGKVRYKGPFSNDYAVFLTAIEEGSVAARFKWNLKNAAVVSMLSSVVVDAAISGPVSKLSTDFFSYIANQTIGRAVSPETDPINELVERRRGETEAIMQAITPSLKRSHNVIGHGAGQIIVINGDNNVVRLDRETKDYINSDRADVEISMKLVSVGRMNGNQRDVGVYDAEEGRVITGYIPADAAERTMGNLSRSLTIYVEETGDSRLFIKYRKVTDPNGRILRYVIYDAWFDGEFMRNSTR